MCFITINEKKKNTRELGTILNHKIPTLTKRVVIFHFCGHCSKNEWIRKNANINVKWFLGIHVKKKKILFQYFNVYTQEIFHEIDKTQFKKSSNNNLQ